MICICGKEHEGTFGSGKFCSRSCANKRNHSIETREKISRGTKGLPAWNKKRDKKIKGCKVCGSTREKFKQFCKECRYTYQNIYRIACEFDFCISDYPEWFDISLYEKYGTYTAKNRGGNFNGIVRDHMFSVSDAFALGLDSKIVKHPANCKLMNNPQNLSKWKHSSITLNELYERIELFNKQYS
jgi:hypothetical protein